MNLYLERNQRLNKKLISHIFDVGYICGTETVIDGFSVQKPEQFHGKVTCFSVELDGEEWTEDSEKAYRWLIRQSEALSKKEIAIIPHKTEDIPHIHIIYLADKKNEFQKFLYSHQSEEFTVLIAADNKKKVRRTYYY